MSGSLRDSWHAVLRVRVDVGTQLVGGDAVIDRMRDGNNVFGGRNFLFAQIQPLPDVSLPNLAAWQARTNTSSQSNLPPSQLNRTQ